MCAWLLLKRVTDGLDGNVGEVRSLCCLHRVFCVSFHCFLYLTHELNRRSFCTKLRSATPIYTRLNNTSCASGDWTTVCVVSVCVCVLGAFLIMQHEHTYIHTGDYPCPYLLSAAVYYRTDSDFEMAPVNPVCALFVCTFGVVCACVCVCACSFLICDVS